MTLACSPRSTICRSSRLTAIGGHLVILSLLLLDLTGCGPGAPKAEGRPAAMQSYVQAVLQYKSGDTEKAISTLQASIVQHPEVTMAHDLLGDLYHARHEFVAALEQYQISSKLDPYGSINHYKQGLALQLLGRSQEAIAAYLRALRLNPRDFGANLNLAAAYLSLNHPQDALPYARTATELDDHSGLAWCDFGVSLELLGKYEEAEMPLRKALEWDTRPEIAIALVENYVHQKKYKEARSVMGQVLQAKDSSQNRKRMADIMFLQKDYDEAIQEYARALRIDKTFYPALNEIGWVLIMQYQQSLGLDEAKRIAALDTWRRSLDINPEQPRITRLMHAYNQKYSDDK